MESTFRNEIYEHAKQWVLEAGELIRQKINDPHDY